MYFSVRACSRCALFTAHRAWSSFVSRVRLLWCLDQRAGSFLFSPSRFGRDWLWRRARSLRLAGDMASLSAECYPHKLFQSLDAEAIIMVTFLASRYSHWHFGPVSLDPPLCPSFHRSPLRPPPLFSAAQHPPWCRLESCQRWPPAFTVVAYARPRGGRSPTLPLLPSQFGLFAIFGVLRRRCRRRRALLRHGIVRATLYRCQRA